MAEDIQENQSQVQELPVQSETNTNIVLPFDTDASLDGALEKTFNIKPVSQPNDKPIEQSKPNSDKPVDPKVENPPKQIKTEEIAQPLPDPEKIENNPSKNQQGWTSLKNNYKRAHKVIADKDQELAKIKAALAERGETTTKEVEDLKKQVQELSGFRAMVDIQADPEFVSKFDAPIEKNISSIKNDLLAMNVSQEIVDKVDFSNTKLMEDIINHVSEHKDKFTARKLERKVQDLLDLSDKRDETIVEHRQKHKEYLENKKKESFTKTAETEGRTIKRLEEVAKNIPFLSKISPKEGATDPEIEQVDRHNQMVDFMTQKVNEVLKMDTAEQKAEVAVAAVGSHYLNSQLKIANQKIASLENEIKKISNVSSDTEKTRHTNTRRSNMNGNGDKDIDTALQEHFSEAQ